jgi:Tfp pilus assembly protein PilZ
LGLFYQAFLPPVQLGHQLAGVGVGLDDNKAGRIVKAILAEIEVRWAKSVLQDKSSQTLWHPI